MRESVGRERYRFLARGYDAFSGEQVYRVGRRLGVDLLDLRSGATVLDLGCGTGLNLPLLLDRIGSSGRVVALDASPEMLARAGARVRRAGWSNVTLLCADAQTVDPRTVVRLAGGKCDSALATYALALMPRWRQAWDVLRACCRPDARVAVVDTRVPDATLPVRALGRLACAFGGVDVDSHPWRVVEQDCVDVSSASAWAGHVQVRVGVPGTIRPWRTGRARPTEESSARRWS